MTHRIIPRESGTDLSGRATARALRARVVSLAASGARIELDFSGVRSIADSFLDELCAVLIASRGEDWFRDHVRVTNIDSDTRADLSAVIARRPKSELASVS